MTRLWSMIAGIPRQILIGVVRGYQLFISPLSPSTCRFQPTCSAYAIEALRRYGFWKGLVLSVYRLGRCHPWGGHGYDPPRWFGEPKRKEVGFKESEGKEPDIEKPFPHTSPVDSDDADNSSADPPYDRVPDSREEERSDATSKHAPATSESAPAPPISSTDTQSADR